jgi:acyl dehydratase
MKHIHALEDLDSLVGEGVAVGQSLQIDQMMLDQFLELCGDTNKIHRTSPSNSQPIIPGNFLISLVPQLLQSQMSIHESIECFTVGYQMIKFRAPVRLQDTVIFNADISSVRCVKKARHVVYDFTFRNQDQSKVSMEGQMTDLYRKV